MVTASPHTLLAAGKPWYVVRTHPTHVPGGNDMPATFMRSLRLFSLVVVLLPTLASASDAPQDRDGDGIWDIHEKVLGTDPDSADVPHTCHSRWC